MPVTSLIIEMCEGAGEAVMNSLAGFPNVSVYGIKDNQIVAVIDGKDIASVEDTMKALLTIKDVTGVYPVFAGDFE